jgi:hypothetical protein
MPLPRIPLLSILLLTSIATAADPPAQLSRHDFAQRLLTIKKGMSSDEVRQLLGPPDDIRKLADGSRSGQHFQEAWCYGTSGHLTLPTLGQVLIETDGKVMRDAAMRYTPLPPPDFDETEMRRLLHILDNAPGEHEFQPQPLIAAVNALHPLGKEKALDVVQEYARIAPFNRQQPDLMLSMSFVLQALFGYDQNLVDLKIVDDVPFVPGVAGGYSGPSAQSTVFSSCRHIRERNLPLRDKPLQPTTDLRKLRQDALKMAASDRSPDRASPRVNQQLFALLAPVYKMPEGWIFSDDSAKSISINHELEKLPVRWDTATNQYVLAPPTTRPAQPTNGPTNAKLIDQLVDITHQQFSIRTNIFAVGSGTRLPQGLRMMQEPGPDPSFAMTELARRGVDALPDLLAHLDDDRKTQVTIKGMGPGIRYSAEYDWNPHTAKAPPAGIVDLNPSSFHTKVNIPEEVDHHSYDIRVGDLCFNIIGQIVNRRFLCVRYQPSAIVIVNSPVLCPDLRDAVRNEWSHTTREKLRDSLVADVATPASSTQTAAALDTLARDFPDALHDAVRDRLKLPTYDQTIVREFAMTELYIQPDPAKRLALIDRFVKDNGPGYRDGLLLQLWQNRTARPGQRLVGGPGSDSIPTPTIPPAEILTQLLTNFDPNHHPTITAVEQRTTASFIDHVTTLNRPDLNALIAGR